MKDRVTWLTPQPEFVPDGDLLVEVDTKSGSDVKVVYIEDDCQTLIEPDSGDVWSAWQWDDVSRYLMLEGILAKRQN